MIIVLRNGALTPREYWTPDWETYLFDTNEWVQTGARIPTRFFMTEDHRMGRAVLLALIARAGDEVVGFIYSEGNNAIAALRPVQKEVTNAKAALRLVQK